MDIRQDKMTLIIFSNDMDKALAAFILATGAASSGMQVSMFFTFWGLSLLREGGKVHGRKTLIERMFGWILPKGPDGTTLSKMHFLGAGTNLMKRIMRKKKILQLHELMNIALSLNVRFVACTTSMKLMGIKQNELIENIDVGGVATYLGDARESTITLFI
ncbi:Sulfur carrier protein DsrE2 [subsurface metagenome]